MGVWTGITNPNPNHYCYKRNLGETHHSHQTLIVQWDQIWSREVGGLGEKILGVYVWVWVTEVVTQRQRVL